MKHTSNNPKGMEDMKVDYTPPSYITLMFTDLGVFTTAAVSEKIIELYT
jgi:translation initiation factor eIF-2B subunit alpha